MGRWNGFDDVSLEEFEVTRNGLIYCDCGRVIPCRHCDKQEVRVSSEMFSGERLEYAILLPNGNLELRRMDVLDPVTLSKFTPVFPSLPSAEKRVRELEAHAESIGVGDYRPKIVKRTVSRGAWEPA